MFESEKKSSLDRLRKGLYSPNIDGNGEIRHSIHGQEINVPESWGEKQAEGQNPENPENTEKSENVAPVTPERRYAYKIIFLCSALFLVAAFAIAAYTFFGGGNFVSVENVDIQISGPGTISGGEPLSLDVSVANKNKTDIQLVDLVVEYPQGTKDPDNPAKDLSRSRISLGDIKSGALAQQTASALLFGEEGDVKQIKFTAEYRTADSNAIFYKEKLYNVTISSSPVLISIDALDKVLSGDPVDVTVTVSSNSTSPLKNLLMTLDYPFGFSVISSDPPASYGDNVWRIGDLAPGAKRVIKFRASATGQDGEDRTVHANVGIQSDTNEREIATTIISRDHTFTLEKPFLGLDLALEGNHSDLAIESGHSVHADVIWTNNSQDNITNTKITAKLSGNVLDQNSVSVENGGFYDSETNTITWQAGRADGLDSIKPGDSGKVSFTVLPLPTGLGRSVGSPQITIAVSADGTRVDANGAPQSINTAVTRSIKVVSNLSLSARALYSQGPFKNTGPVPPRVDQETTYTVVWTVTNTSNTITGAKVTANLPQYVAWVGATSPADGSITYDDKTGSITWLVGEVPKNADIGSGAKQMAFQIKLKPSANQAGSIPTLVSDQAITGTDIFTGSTLTNSTQNLSTRISTDLLYKNGDETVQK